MTLNAECKKKVRFISSRDYGCVDDVDTDNDPSDVRQLVPHPTFQHILLQSSLSVRALFSPPGLPSHQVSAPYRPLPNMAVFGKCLKCALKCLPRISSGMLKEQTNWRDHWPGNDDQDGPPPVFIPMKGYTWLYVTIPIILYLFDWSWRKVSRRQPVSVSRVVVHEPDVIELVVDRWMSHSQPGQVSSPTFIHNS